MEKREGRWVVLGEVGEEEWERNERLAGRVETGEMPVMEGEGETFYLTSQVALETQGTDQTGRQAQG
jgi:hypothetical protein